MNNIWKDDAIDIITTLNQNNIYCHNVLNYAQREMAELTTILDNSKKTTFRIYNLIAFNIYAGFFIELNSIKEIDGKCAISKRFIKTSFKEFIIKSSENIEYKRNNNRCKTLMNKKTNIQKESNNNSVIFESKFKRSFSIKST